MIQEQNKLQGKRFINWVRCSTDHQAGTSIPDQIALLNDFAAKAGMIHIDNVILDGVSGSIPGARDDIELLIRRKRVRDDFDVVLLQDMTRLTRSGSEHAAKIEYDLRAHGIEIVYAAENLPQGDHASIIKSVGFYAAKQHAKSISHGIARGQMSALLKGTMPYCSTPPYGIDRLIVNRKDEPLFILRNLHDGTQVKLTTDGKTELQVFPPSTEKGKSSHYRRQVDERILFVAGSDESVQTVRSIFDWHHRQGWGRHRITSELNRLGIRAPRGGSWTTPMVAKILRNSIYLGRSVVNRTSQSIYHMRSPNAPVQSAVDPQELVSRKTPKKRVRAEADWITLEHEQLKDFLDADVRKLAAAAQAKYWSSKGRQMTPPFSTNKHVESPFILSQILREKGTGHKLSGRTTGPKGKKLRYYAVTRSVVSPSAGITSKLVPATPLEQAVLAQVKSVLLDMPSLRDEILQQLRARAIGKTTEQDQLPKLEQERQALKAKLEWLIDHLGTVGKSTAAEKMADIEQKLMVLTARIEAARAATKKTAPVNLDEQADAIANWLHGLGENIGSLPTKTLRMVLESVIERLEIDLHTRAVELDLRLPPWAENRTTGAGKELCLEATQLWRGINEAQWVFTLKIAEIDCRGLRNPNRFDCCRRRKAA